MTWGAFQDQVVVKVEGVEGGIAERYDNLIQFYPPDQALLNPGSECQTSTDAHLVEVSGVSIFTKQYTTYKLRIKKP